MIESVGWGSEEIKNEVVMLEVRDEIKLKRVIKWLNILVSCEKNLDLNDFVVAEYASDNPFYFVVSSIEESGYGLMPTEYGSDRIDRFYEGLPIDTVREALDKFTFRCATESESGIICERSCYC